MKCALGMEVLLTPGLIFTAVCHLSVQCVYVYVCVDLVVFWAVSQCSCSYTYFILRRQFVKLRLITATFGRLSGVCYSAAAETIT